MDFEGDQNRHELPAILGGVPLLPSGPPTWPLNDPAVADVLRGLVLSGDWGRYHSGHVSELSARLSDEHAVPHTLLTSSGTAAVELALRGLRVESGDEVVLAAYDFKANFTNVTWLGACPVLVDIQKHDGQIDLDQLANAITTKTKAILVSHLHGAAVEMPKLMDFARDVGIPVIEDACQMSLATIYGQRAGTWGDVGVISFGGSKLLTAGRGGAVMTSSDAIQQRIRLYTERGNEAYPLSEMQAAVLLPQLDSLPERRRLRSSTAQSLRAALRNRSGVKPFAASSSSSMQTQLDYYKLGFWYESGEFDGLSREQFCACMRAEGIPIDPGFRSLHRIHARRRFRTAGVLPVADWADECVVKLHHPYLLEGERGVRVFLAALDRLQSHARILVDRVRC